MTKEEAIRQCGTKLSFADMQSISGVAEEYWRLLQRLGEINMDLMACDKPIQRAAADTYEGIKAAVEAARKQFGSYQPMWAIQPAREVFTWWWHNHPAGKARIMSYKHRQHITRLAHGSNTQTCPSLLMVGNVPRCCCFGGPGLGSTPAMSSRRSTNARERTTDEKKSTEPFPHRSSWG